MEEDGPHKTLLNTVKYMGLRVTKITGSRADDWIYWHIGYFLSLNYNQNSVIADLHPSQFAVVHALGFSVFTSRLLATDLNTETSTSNHNKVFLPFLVQSSWTADSPELDPILQFYRQPISSLSSLDFVLTCTQLISAANMLPLYRRGTDPAENTALILLRGAGHIENTSTVLLRGAR
jgi:hypothetical protein